MLDHCESLIVNVSVRRLHRICDPFLDVPWHLKGELSPELVLQCYDRGLFIPEPIGCGAGLSAETHARRIAWLIDQGWKDPITLEFPEDPDRPGWPIQDGNHRFYAALMREDDYIAAFIGGFLDTAEQALGIAIP